MKGRYASKATNFNASLSIDLVEQAIAKYASKMGRLVRTDPDAVKRIAVPILTASDFDVVDTFDSACIALRTQSSALSAADATGCEETKDKEDGNEEKNMGPTPEEIDRLQRANAKVQAMKELNNYAKKC